MAGGLGLGNRHRAWFQVEESLRVSTRGGSDVAPAPLWAWNNFGVPPDGEAECLFSVVRPPGRGT